MGTEPRGMSIKESVILPSYEDFNNTTGFGNDYSINTARKIPDNTHQESLLAP